MANYETAAFIFSHIEHEARALEFQEYSIAIDERKKKEHTPTTHIEAKTRLGMGIELSKAANRLQDVIVLRKRSNDSPEATDPVSTLIRARTHRGKVIVVNEQVGIPQDEVGADIIEFAPPEIEQPVAEMLEGLGTMALASQL
jgi:hypothetical protein